MTKKADTILEIRTIPKSFDPELIITAGTQSIDGFNLNKKLEKFYEQLYYYFIRDKRFEQDLNKGLLIIGSVGTGKTTAMRMFSKIGRYRVVTTRHIVREFNIDGMTILNRYGKDSFYYKGVPSEKVAMKLCFDDIGLEDVNSKIFGNRANVLAEILLDRYDCFISDGMITHATTNLSIPSLKEIYGDKLLDRLKEMMNLITCEGQSLRK